MALDMVIGAQWGDEGKGRITDMLAAQADMVARFSGGDNAGHTVTVAGEIFKLHLIPSGIIHPGVIRLIGNGTVINPAVLLREMDGRVRVRSLPSLPAVVEAGSVDCCLDEAACREEGVVVGGVTFPEVRDLVVVVVVDELGMTEELEMFRL